MWRKASEVHRFRLLASFLLFVVNGKRCFTDAFLSPSPLDFHSAGLSRNRAARPIQSLQSFPPRSSEQEFSPQNEIKQQGQWLNNVDDHILAAIYATPLIMTAGAFVSYDTARIVFHGIVDIMSAGANFVVVDGGDLVVKSITPALNGPVQTSISITFGSLVAMTISNLYQRQVSMHRYLVNMVETLLLLQDYVAVFPLNYRKRAKDTLDKYVIDLRNDIQYGQLSAETMRENNLRRFIRLMNDLSFEPNQGGIPDRVLDEAYTAVGRIDQERAALMSILESSFPAAHYVNLLTLAIAISTLFFVETDQEAIKFIANFQLRLCWTMLVGTFSMLGIVLFDLNSLFTGRFRIMQPTDINLELFGIYQDATYSHAPSHGSRGKVQKSIAFSSSMANGKESDK